jgi:drug/metabolite transporter (DMT)-like permease
VPLLAAVALACFAANSILARVALRSGAIDPASFTALRLAAGAALLLVITRGFGPRRPSSPRRPPVLGAILLFLYAAPFSFAYVNLPAGTGALILFAAVQLTMIGAGIAGGERPPRLEWLGLLIAVAGLVILNLPGVTAPPLGAALLMAVAGAAWGGYSLHGRRAGPPLAETARSFLLATPMALLVALGALRAHTTTLTPRGAGSAGLSGALASGAGYAAWYAVLPRLSATRAGTLQLAVPILAALAGILLLGEALTARLALCSAAVLGGIGLAVSRTGAPNSPDP